MFNPDTIFPIFIGTWIVLGVISFYFFGVRKDAQLKRKIWPYHIIGVGLLFALFIFLMGFPISVFAIMGPAIILITYLNLKAVRFCDACGKTIMNQNLFSSPEFCTKCGAKLSS